MRTATALGIEFGSTRIKAILIDGAGEVLASGSYRWENTYQNGLWTYPLSSVWEGLAAAYRALKKDYRATFGKTLRSVDVIGISAMMHGYLAFDREGRQIAEFRTWRNTVTAEAAEALTEAFGFHIPQRWSCAYLYQAILNREADVNRIASLNTLAGYVHETLTGRRVLGIGDASGMFPVDPATRDYDVAMLHTFDALSTKKGFPTRIAKLLPEILVAGKKAGRLTSEGARRIDPEGDLNPGILFCPPEGDMQTGMVATGSVRVGTGNISAGTSINACIIPEAPIRGMYRELDLVATPDGNTSALLHANTCTSEIDAWATLFSEAAEAMGMKVDLGEVLNAMFRSATRGKPDADGILYYNYVSGEPIAGLDEGCPLLLRRPDSKLSFAEFSRAQLYGAVSVLRMGLDILREHEGVHPKLLIGHGGFFKTPGVGQQIMADAMQTPIGILKTAGEGGPWGMAILALYAANGTDRTLPDFLEETVFKTQENQVLAPDPDGAAGFDRYLRSYKENLALVHTATRAAKCPCVTH